MYPLSFDINFLFPLGCFDAAFFILEAASFVMAEGDRVILMTGSSCVSYLVSGSGDESIISGDSAIAGGISGYGSSGCGMIGNSIGLGPISSTVLSFILRANSVIAGESVSLKG